MKRENLLRALIFSIIFMMSQLDKEWFVDGQPIYTSPNPQTAALLNGQLEQVLDDDNSITPTPPPFERREKVVIETKLINNDSSGSHSLKPAKDAVVSDSFQDFLNGHYDSETTNYQTNIKATPPPFRRASSYSPLNYHRFRRSYKFPANLDLSQFYVPNGLTNGNDELTPKELELEQEKFLRLLSILSSTKSVGAAEKDDELGFNENDIDNNDEPPIDLAYYGSYNPITGEKLSKNMKAGKKHSNAEEPIITLMTSHPKNMGRRSRPYNNEVEELEWLEEPISIRRHRLERRGERNPVTLLSGIRPHLKGNGQFGTVIGRNIAKRVNDYYDDETDIANGAGDQTQLYSLNQLLSKSQNQDTRFPLKHRFIL